MDNRLLSHLLDISLRSVPLALAAFAVLRMRWLRSAAWAHAVWTMVVLSMLVLFGVGPVLKPIPLRVLPARPGGVSRAVEVAIPMEYYPAVSSAERVRADPRGPGGPPHSGRRFSGGEIVMVIYILMAAGLLARLLVGSWLARRLLAGSARAGEEFYEAARIAVPLTIGWLRPVILLPSSWRSWDQSKLEAVLLHENSHIRRRDSLVALLAGLNRCVFWFHPLAWWMERKLAFLAEQACDEACVSALDNRRGYARVLLEMAGAVEASGGRVSGHALAMARPSQVRQRIEAILDETRVAHRGLTAMSWAAVLLCGGPLVYAAGSMRFEQKMAPPAPQVSASAALKAAQPSEKPSMARPEPTLVAQAAAPVQANAASPSPTLIRHVIHFEGRKFTGVQFQVQSTSAPQPPVLLPVVVLEPAGRFVTGLGPENFQIMEGQTTYPVTSFATAEGLHAIGVLNTTAASRDAVDAFQKVLDPHDESFAVEGPSASNAEGFWDAIANAVTEVKQRQNPVKAVVVMMQGGSGNPWAPEPMIARVLRLAARAPRVAVYFANVEDIGEAVTVPRSSTQQVDLSTIAGATGGQVIPVARPAEMTTALERIGTELRHQYLLGIVPPSGAPGALDRLSFEIVKTPGLPPLRVIGPQAIYLH